MPALPAWLPLAVDAVIGITLVLFLLHGLRRGLFELSLSTVLLIVNLTFSTLAGVGLSTLNLPYGALITVLGSGLAWILTGMLLRRVLKGPLWKLDQRDVPIWEAALGALLGLARGVAVVLLIGLSVVTPWQVLVPELVRQTPSPMLWSAISPLGAPASGWLQEQTIASLKEAQAAGDQANELTRLLGGIAAKRFEQDVVDELSNDRQYDINERGTQNVQNAQDVLDN